MFARKAQIDPAVSWFVFGPRGTGKTHWLKNQFAGATYLDLLESRTFNLLSADPQRLEGLIPLQPETPIIIDEIQKIPELLNEVHRLIESRKLSFIMTGSSARKLRREGVNLLGGRANTLHFHPLTAVELGSSFQLEKALRFGLLPSLYDPDKTCDPGQYLQSYVQTYLKEEVLQEGLTRNLTAFSRFLEAASLSQAQPLNISEVARECQIKRKQAESYFGILEDLLVGIMVPPFTKRAHRRLMAHPKFFFFDAGVFRAMRPTGPLDTPAEMDGPALETLVLQHLRALISWKHANIKLHYWRTATGLEADFVLYGDGLFLAIEVKRKRSLSRSDLQGLKTFADEYPEAKRLMLYGGDHPQNLQGIRILPLAHFFPQLQSLDDLIRA